LGTLREQLKQINAKLAEKLPEEFRATSPEAIQNLMLHKTAEGLTIGETAPDFVLPDATGKEVNLYKALADGPVVLSFYRGSW
jgi:hypothetical protein